ncbi:MAG: PAS domain S-box protein [Candidatus Odinarchaeota archaeon]
MRFDSFPTPGEVFQKLEDIANDAIFIMKDDVFLDCNRKTLEMFNCTRKQILGNYPYAFSPPTQPNGRESKEYAQEKIHNAIAGESQFFEWVHVTRDGRPFFAEVNLNSIDIEGETFIQAMVRDIDERKRAEEELRESERKFREMTDLLPEAVYESNIGGSLTFLNQSGVDLTGYSQEDLDRGLNLLQLITPEDQGRVRNNLRILLRGAYLGYNEYSLLQKSGNRVPVLVHSVSITMDGDITGLRDVIIDITSRKAAEEAIRKREAQLREIIDLVPHLIYAKDMEGRYILVNKATADSYGLSPEDFTDKTYEDLICHLDEDSRKERLRE